MLKFSINNKGLAYREEMLTDDEATGSKGVVFVTQNYQKEKIKVKTTRFHNLSGNEGIMFTLNADNGERLLSTEKSYTIKSGTEFEIEPFSDYKLGVKGCKLISDFNLPYSSTPVHGAIMFTFNDRGHDFVTTVKKNIKYRVGGLNGMPYEMDNENEKHCIGDYILYNDIFLLKMGKVEDNEYVFSTNTVNEDENLLHDIYFYRDGEKIVLENCLIPYNMNGYANRNCLYWGYNKNNATQREIAEYISKNYNVISFYTVDDRYFFFHNGVLSLKQGSDIVKEVGDISISLPFTQFNDVNLTKEDIYNEKLLDEIIEENINDIVDMEKQIFIPTHIGDDNKKYNLRKLNFNIELKQRGDDAIFANNSISFDDLFNAWKDNDSRNKWVGRVENCDLLGYWGFTDEDIIYQKNSLKKSFLRFSFYDTNKRSTQSLLYYSTIFLDSGQIYGKYVKNINKGFSNENSMSSNADTSNGKYELLTSSLCVTDNSDYTQSSEGFYLYLFPSLCKGTMPTRIYMKVEFNHAKFGYTIPLVTSRDINGDKKDGYLSVNGDVSKINELFGDMYMPIDISYNNETHNYEWSLSEINHSVNANDEITLNLYEPIINKTE